MDSVSEKLSDQRAQLSSATQVSISMLSNAGDDMQEQTRALEDMARNISEQLREHTSSLNEGVNDLEARGSTTAHHLALASQKLRQEKIALSGTVRISTDTIEDATSDLGKALLDFTKIEQQVRSKTTSAVDDVRAATRGLMDDAAHFAKQTEMLRDELKSTMGKELVRTSAQLLETLEESAIDIAQALDVNIPDKVWRRFLAGDNRAFLSRAARMGGRRLRHQIEVKFKKDSEFRTAATRYMRHFENLMRRVVTDELGDSWSLALNFIRHG